MKILRASFLVLALASSTTAERCPCVDAPDNANCQILRQTSSGACEVVTEECRGCVCDLSGTKVCEIVTEDSSPDQGTCGGGSITRAICPDPSFASVTSLVLPTANDPGVLTTSCAVSGLASTEYPCDIACFDESLGQLTGISISYVAQYDAFFELWNTDDSEATGVDLVQTGLLEAYGSVNDGVYFIESPTVVLQPALNGIDMGPGEIARFDTYASDIGGTNVSPNSEQAKYLSCSSDNDPDDLANFANLIIVGFLQTQAPATVNTTTMGNMYAKMTIQYTYVA